MAAPILAILNTDDEIWRILDSGNFNGAVLQKFSSISDLCVQWHEKDLPIVAIISQAEIMGSYGISIVAFLQKKGMPSVPFFIITTYINENMKTLSLNAGVTDVFVCPIQIKSLEIRINFCTDNWSLINSSFQRKVFKTYKIFSFKRVFRSITYYLLNKIIFIIYPCSLK